MLASMAGAFFVMALMCTGLYRCRVGMMSLLIAAKYALAGRRCRCPDFPAIPHIVLHGADTVLHHLRSAADLHPRKHQLLDVLVGRVAKLLIASMNNTK